MLLGSLIYWCCAWNTLSETKIQNFTPLSVAFWHPRPFHMEVPPGSWRPITSIIGLNPELIYEKKTYRFIKTYSQICALNSCDKRHSEKLTVNRQMN